MNGHQFDLFPQKPEGSEAQKEKPIDIPDNYLGLLDQPLSYITSEIARAKESIYKFKMSSDDTARDFEEYLEALNKVLTYKNEHEDEESA